MPTGERPTILIVEDEENVAESYQLYLDSDYEILLASSGGEALVTLDSSIDVVLLDRRMPGLSGDEVLEHIQDMEYDCRVVMVTAVDPAGEIVEMPFDDYLTKPVSQEALADTVEELLLLDEYEELLSEYNAVVKTYATLKSQLSQHGLEETQEVDELEQRKEALRGQINDVIDGLDEEMAAVFREAHHAG
ncbi:response regulator [Halorientalis brevis]|uniref:Response regulator n=1 Tax=Halorientalis brevis TaxID=1126241 RepID=A0ABD6CC67_9EURY|nr:response regulator [Halorientalis brevis]